VVIGVGVGCGLPDLPTWMALEPYQAQSLALALWKLARDLDLRLREADARPSPGDKRC
jgi:hypothetical protein